MYKVIHTYLEYFLITKIDTVEIIKGYKSSHACFIKACRIPE